MLLRRVRALRSRRASATAVPRYAAARALGTAAESDTIYALSSAEGKAGVAVIRISGESAEQCLRQLSKTETLPEARMAAFRKLYHPVSKEHLDDAIAIRFPQPRSFTGEDVVELHVHGSIAVVSGVMEALSHMPHCRVAEPGEFTERAFENNKIDLMQVEGLADLLSAETEAQRTQALRQLSGEIGDVYEHWRSELVRCLAYTEAMIDFGDDEDDVTDASYEAAIDRVRALATSIQKHLADGRKGEILRNGVQVAILGPPNAGKSSLLNILARRPAAIVSSIAGTTRDIVQVPLNIAGYPVLVSDTAGLRETEDAIEQEGVLRAQQCATEADVRIVMMDIQNTELLGTEEYQSYIRDDAMIVLNKSDQTSPDAVAAIVHALGESAPRDHIHVISCSTSDGIDALIEKLAAIVKQKLQFSSGGAANGAIITRERHRQNLVECLACLDSFLENPYQSEIAAEDLRRAVVAVGRILGRIDVEDVLDVLFADFCIGK
uniref:TrmE-type G domain-containing protein n=1 Tax=Globisporangium ultimum (strain ATCC 200006 / CBS 805.95 / DAOM BR144) TaxID=431595 RepID=K3WYT9_GLOUD